VNRPAAGHHIDACWQKLYEAAVLELDVQVLPRRIHLARKAIKARVAELICTGESSETERLLYALNVLEDLLKMNKNREGKR
jgi:hypothetical protein